MLLQFRFKNFRSFADEAVLDLTATGIKENSNSLIEINGNKVLPVAAIYGPNASGKSNLFLAFKSMFQEVFWESAKSTNHSNITPYFFKKDLITQPCEFEICIYSDNKEYRYGFVRDQEKILEEWLFSKKFVKNTKASEKLIFHRELQHTSIGKIKQIDANELEYASSVANDNQLLLSIIGNRGKSEFCNVFTWFQFSDVSDFSNERDEVFNTKISSEFLYENSEYLKQVSNLISLIDPSIIQLKIKPEIDKDMNTAYKWYSVHKNDEGKRVYMPFASESSGTKKLLSLAVAIMMSLNSGVTIWADELDAKLHPLVLRYILKLFNDRKTNPGNGQLIFSAHNIVCLDSSDLRRDEIWFVEKNDQKSILFSLYDFKCEDESIRSDLDFGKNYLAGRFGAIPFRDEVK